MSEKVIKVKPQFKKNDMKLKATVYIISVILAYFMLKPIYEMFKELFFGTAQTVYGKSLPFLKACKIFFEDFNYMRPFLNSVYVSVFTTVFCIYISALTSYAITAYEWKLRESFDKMIIVIMMVPSTVATVGFYQMVYKLGLINKPTMLIFPAIASPLTVFFMRMYLQATFSMEIVESARLDGASEFRIFNQIILPILKPAIATQAIFAFVNSWSNSFVPMIILIEGSKRTLPIAISSNLLSIHSVLLVLPPILVYAFFSKHIVEGISLGGIKF